ncbi:Complement component 1 Q subcomponent-binding protein, mitochondrial [Intoshia linei]|uniref:Complement component 1 Q subcomponent-binding protein, mitochondrial n=1 Tax=Intoshia linei TaxID=1819745 RepID=A0A177AUU9_9BILA|nr:Complement component 1 Q subcomponent-binding protein, mitochondrial [Intoshia linei]
MNFFKTVFGLSKNVRFYSKISSFRIPSTLVVNCRKFSGTKHKVVHYIAAYLENENISKCLRDEINEIEKFEQSLPSSISDFKISKDNGKVKCINTYNQEEVSVESHVNSLSFDDENDEMGEINEDSPEQFISKPNFVVTIQKSFNEILSFDCSYIEEAEDKENCNTFQIDTISFINKTNDEPYYVDPSMMTEKMYEMFIQCLKTRGINSNFLNEFSEYIDSYERNCYTEFLKKLEKFKL